MADDGVIVGCARLLPHVLPTQIDRRRRYPLRPSNVSLPRWHGNTRSFYCIWFHLLGTRIWGGRVLLELPSCAKSCTRARTFQVCMEYELPWIGVAVQIKQKTVVLRELLTSDLAYACVREPGRQQKLPRRCLFY